MKLNIFKKKPQQKPKSKLIEWRDSIVFAVVVATLFRWSFVEAFVIPTPSMENSLLVGDYLFVSKFHYGARTPHTPLQIPLTHQKIWGTNIPSYLDWVQLPSYRLPGLRGVERGEPVVFNVPKDLLDPTERPIDLKTYLVKRCVGIGGDKLEVRNKQVFINDHPLDNPVNMKFSYQVVAKDEINLRNLVRLGLDSDDYYYLGRTPGSQAVYKMFLTAAELNEIKSIPYILSIEEERRNEPEANIFPSARGGQWNADNYGPLIIPKKGMNIPINDSTLNVYRDVIELYEGNKGILILGNALLINGEPVQNYVFKQDYYFMMGDNRDNSLDSRYWGFVPEDHILGKPLFIWMSVNSEADLLHKIRWHRMFSLVK